MAGGIDKILDILRKAVTIDDRVGDRAGGDTLHEKADLLLATDLNHLDGTLTATGAEQTIFDKTSTEPWMFRGGKIDLANMDADDTVIIRFYETIRSGCSERRLGTDADGTYSGVATVGAQLVPIESETFVYRFRITLEQTAHGAGGLKDFDWLIKKVDE